MTTLYLSGKMTGLPDHNYPAFHAAAAELRAVGYRVINPAELGTVEGWTWEQYLRRDLQAMLADADALALLEGCDRSAGAQLEATVAHALGWRVLPVESWIAMAYLVRVEKKVTK
jgi:hypothetical protein